MNMHDAATLPIAVTCGLKNTRGKFKIELYTCVCRPVVSNPEEDEEGSATLTALIMEGDCVLDCYLSWDSYDSSCCKTI